MKSTLGKTMLWITGILIVLALIIAAFLQHPKFGTPPNGVHKASIQESSNYGENGFKNQINTPLFAGDQSLVSVLWQNLRSMGTQLSPIGNIPSDHSALSLLDSEQNMLIWLGHSTFYIQFEGQRILIDPVFGPNAAPIPGMIPAYAGTTPISAADFGAIDYLFITHDHWDHLDYDTLKSLQHKVGKVITPLGVGAYLTGWGYESEKVSEGDWYDSFDLNANLKVHLIPARHYSGRLLKRHQTLWAGFILESPAFRLLISGDTGYGPHFKEIAERFDGFDLVALDQGQYDPRWPYIHMTPDEALTAAEELGAKRLLPAHVGKYTLAKHHWMEPFTRIEELSKASGIVLATPIIGEAVELNRQSQQTFKHWWENLPTPTN